MTSKAALLKANLLFLVFSRISVAKFEREDGWLSTQNVEFPSFLVTTTTVTNGALTSATSTSPPSLVIMPDPKSPSYANRLSPSSSHLFSDTEITKPIKIKFASSAASPQPKWKDAAREIEADIRILPPDLTTPKQPFSEHN